MFQVSELWGMKNKLESSHRVTSLWSTLSFLILIFFRFIYFRFTCINLLLACMYVHHKHAWYLWRPEEGFRSLETGDTDNCDLYHVGSLKESSERAAGALDRWIIYPAMSPNFSY